MSEYISRLGPGFYVGEGTKQLCFQRVVDGPEEGGVNISLVIDGEVHFSRLIDAASWPSVLAHVCRSSHDGATFAFAKAFHEFPPAPVHREEGKS